MGWEVSQTHVTNMKVSPDGTSVKVFIDGHVSDGDVERVFTAAFNRFENGPWQVEIEVGGEEPLPGIDEIRPVVCRHVDKILEVAFPERDICVDLE